MRVTERTTCRVCSGSLAALLDLGAQCLAGQFPADGEPDPLRAPLELCRCAGCGLVQLRHTVAPELLYRDYFYRSSVTQTMRRHLAGLVNEALSIASPREWPSVLDIGCNDFTLLKQFPSEWRRTGIDPCLVAAESSGCAGPALLYGAYPTTRPIGETFDLITSIACFYDVDDPVTFASAVRDNLANDGVWCVEVASVDAMWAMTAYDAICHEHLCYYDIQALADVCRRAGLVITDYSHNPCNGGSIRAWVQRDDADAIECPIPHRLPTDWNRFVSRVAENRCDLRDQLYRYKCDGRVVHLLGASTKANTVLQYADLDTSDIAVASDRDPRKVDRRTPGTNIPIVSEEQSRAMRPDVYVTTLQYFRGELLDREKAFLDRGGEIVFVLPVCEVVKRESVVASCS